MHVQVGALGAAKDALREVVQLPLQHPGLFAHGSLARPTKGVLLFGPPGACLMLIGVVPSRTCLHLDPGFPTPVRGADRLDVPFEGVCGVLKGQACNQGRVGPACMFF